MQRRAFAETRVNPYRAFRSGTAPTGAPAAPIVDGSPGFLETLAIMFLPLLGCLGAVLAFASVLMSVWALLC